MVTQKIVRKFKSVDPATGSTRWVEKTLPHGLARRTINKQIGRIKRVFAWAVEEELVEVAVHAALLRVRGLRRNETNAREKPRVRPVTQDDIDAVLLLLPPVVRSMVEVQLLSGARPQEVVFMREEDIVRDGPVWEYRPRRYKTEHHNPDSDPDKDRVIFLGPRAQAVLTPFLELHPGGYLFSPAAAEEARNAAKRRARKSPMTPSQAARRPKGRAHAPIRDHYDVASYRRAIRRACEKAGIPVWCPNRLRHSRLSEIRKRFSLEASRVCAGHREVGVTQIYAEQDHELARKVMVEIG
ncbi:MAG: hypothetical protein K1X57_02945 [Gemmataceae bacterium]|nr:hypothetical protein [Gemmataceae bacterium]